MLIHRNYNEHNLFCLFSFFLKKIMFVINVCLKGVVAVIHHFLDAQSNRQYDILLILKENAKPIKLEIISEKLNVEPSDNQTRLIFD